MQDMTMLSLNGALGWDHMPVALYKRHWRKGAANLAHHHLVIVLFGQVQIIHHDQERIVDAPALLFLPMNDEIELTFSAGAECIIIDLPDPSVSDICGEKSESAHLRIFVEQRSIIQPLHTQSWDELAQLLGLLEEEIKQKDRRFRLAIMAYLRLILIWAMRQNRGGLMKTQEALGSPLQRFRQSVELHFRHHWTVEAYCDALGMGYDRLHMLCKRELGRSPIALIHERLTREAQARLEQSNLSIKEVATGLGFSDPSNFSHFFKRMTGLSPMHYRAQFAQKSPRKAPIDKPDFADWP